MVKRETSKRILGVAMTIVLLGLMFSVLLPPSMAVYVSPGTPSATSVTKPNTITFNNVNLTIRAAERIPVEFLRFSIYNSAGTEIAYVVFNITGVESSDSPSGKFTVTQTTSILNPTYGTGTGFYGYDEVNPPQNGTGFTYGYGYDDGSLTDYTFLYQIVYTTHQGGPDMYGKLVVNSSTYHYTSAATTTFSVNQGDSGGGTSGGSTETTTSTAAQETTSQETLDEIGSDYGVVLSEPFYVTDTDGDGITDFFVDPNGVLKCTGATIIGTNKVFLLSSDGSDDVPQFFWDPTTDTVTAISHKPSTPTEAPYVDEEAETITLTVSIEKEEGEWVYLDITDAYPPEEYPGFTLTVQTDDGRVIETNKVFRRNGKIFVLDDPATQYVFVYKYDILPPDFNPPSGTTINSGFTPPDGEVISIKRPYFLITYQEPVTLISAFLNNMDVTTDVTTTDSLMFTFQPSFDLINGTYIFTITVEDADGNQQSSSARYIVDLPTTPSQPLPWTMIIIVIVIILVIIGILLYLFKSGRLYFEEK